MKLVIHNGSRVWGGNEKWAATLAGGLVRRGHEVIVSCPPGAVREGMRERGIATTRHRPRGEADAVSALDFALWLRRERPDALLLTSWRTLAWGARAAEWARVPRVVVRLGIERDAPASGARSRAFRRRVHALIVNSEEIRARWVRTAPWFPAEQVRVVLNGLAPRAAERAALRQRLRAELALPGDALLVGSVGHLAHRKGFDLLLRAFAAADLPDARLAIAGAGEYGATLRALADELGVAARVHWLGQRPDGPEVIAGCDVFVLASRNEGMANVMLEALAARVPVIATAVSGVRQALAAQPGGTPAGWMVPPDQVEPLAAALREVERALREDPAAVAARTAEALARVGERFGVERMVAECERVLFPTGPESPG
jgi:glycosyltransferase involved in cell wall biosynthesis